ncbi:cobalt-precorrin-5B (C(1))-methyltransferase [Acuticoccus sp.]|uniref:cobalt-precorrin-5B (C(1))-methyltransferase n=1 Tax=Acuticoccus sp. TaxID=1904378 RepID=UPI003B51A6DA
MVHGGQSREDAHEPDRPLRSGWTTGACATAAAKSAFAALVGGAFLDPVEVTLPRGGTAAFALAHEAMGQDEATAGVVKDAGDDPDVTHGALILASVRLGGAGVTFAAGPGVGTVTRPGLPVGVGEPAINPVPRAMIAAAIGEVAARHGVLADAMVTLSIPGGEALAQRTWNPRLGIVGGLSVLGTTGIVTPYSCAAWIHSIHRGIDVARAAGLPHVAASTGSTSERAAQQALGLPDHAMLDMGDFAGGLLKYLARHPLPRLTIAGGFAKLSKLASGAMDLHSSRSTVDTARLAAWAIEAGATPAAVAAIADAPTAMAALAAAQDAHVDLAAAVGRRAAAAARERLGRAPVQVDVMVVDRSGRIVARG